MWLGARAIGRCASSWLARSPKTADAWDETWQGAVARGVTNVAFSEWGPLPRAPPGAGESAAGAIVQRARNQG